MTVQLDAVQSAWLDALAELHGCRRPAVMREALSWFVAREYSRMQRNHRLAVVRLALRAQRFDPITDYLAGRPIVPP